MYNTLHVSVNGNDTGNGSSEQPFRTISKAAAVARPGDTVIVHAGTYREWVKPEFGGLGEHARITYEAAPGEKVIIKGSEIIKDWSRCENGIWRTAVPNRLFGNYNPYSQVIDGDWFMTPTEYKLYTGEVYLDGKALSQADRLESVTSDSGKWFSVVGEETTEIFADFGEADPNRQLAEINVRRSCFYPEKTGLDYITVRGFEMAHAACPWAPPTADQPALLGVNWSKGWIIENNILHDAKCSAVSVGKEASTGNNLCYYHHISPGYQYQTEAVFKALKAGWSKEKIGSHIIRNNRIYDCGQNGIVGHMGGAFSEICSNTIYNIGIRHEYFGYEIAGIKLHAAIDVRIHHNNIYNCSLGTWLDWQAQGVRISSNLYYKNERDMWIEVTHGPLLIDNNIFASPYNISNAAQGTAFVHNLFCGAMHIYNVLNRSTPYHYPHSTDVVGTAHVYSYDDRLYNNIFCGTTTDKNHDWRNGTSAYNDCPESLDEFIGRVVSRGRGDLEHFEKEKQPAYIDGNCYLNKTDHFEKEKNCLCLDHDPKVSFEEVDGDVYMNIELPQELVSVCTETVSTQRLGVTRITRAMFENPDATPIIIDTDYSGACRRDRPCVGPLEFKAGKQRILVYKHQ